MDTYINIIAFNIPYPPDYGGIIDVYYKIKALHALGVKIIFHCFEYERPQARELEALCHEVYYYKRRTGMIANLTCLPYNVYGRKNPRLLKNLLKNNYPVLFEGLHSCYYITDSRLKTRFKIYRESNIEHHYYRQLAKATAFSVKKIFLLMEAIRFRLYQYVIRHANLILAVSATDTVYLRRHFPGKKTELMTSFHANDRITVQPGQSDFILYHAKLSVAENEQAALYLINHVFSKLTCTCIIAGMDPGRRLLDAASPWPNIRIESNPGSERMNYLIGEAHIHLLPTFQNTGLKLKLLYSLFAGRHIVVNHTMLTGSGLDTLCHIADTPQEMIATCNKLMHEPLTATVIAQRENFLIPAYTNEQQAKRLYRMLYEEN
jgi:hypothetical protein